MLCYVVHDSSYELRATSYEIRATSYELQDPGYELRGDGICTLIVMDDVDKYCWDLNYEATM